MALGSASPTWHREVSTRDADSGVSTACRVADNLAYHCNGIVRRRVMFVPTVDTRFPPVWDVAAPLRRRWSKDMDTNDLIASHGSKGQVRSGCLVEGCPCRDARIVSHRRAKFFAHLAVASGETAQRVIVPEPGWTIPQAHAEEIDGT
jgi:hypothetical protein